MRDDNIVDGSNQLALNWKPPKELYTGRRNSDGNLEKIAINEPKDLFREGSSEFETYEALLKALPAVGEAVEWDTLWQIIDSSDDIAPKKWKEKIKDRIYTINRKLSSQKFRWTKGKITRITS